MLKTKEEKQGFLFYKDWEDIFECLGTDKEIADLLRAVFSYVRRGEVPKFSSSGLKVAFKVIQNSIDRDNDKYEKICAARAAAGKKGGRPKNDKEQPENPEENTKAKKVIGFSESCSNCESSPPTAAAENRSNVMDLAALDKNSVAVAKTYGEFFNVVLTDVEYNKLVSDFGEEKTVEYIRRVDEYCEQQGKFYKNYYLTIRKWIKADKEAAAEMKKERAAARARGENSSFDIKEVEKKMLTRQSKLSS